MIFPYTVKHDGVVYPAGAEVPVGIQATKEEKKPEPKVEEKAETEDKPTVKKRPYKK